MLKATIKRAVMVHYNLLPASPASTRRYLLKPTRFLIEIYAGNAEI
jgi:hypothetical protein